MMKYNNINELLDKYFEGNTTISEERTLKSYFASSEVREEHRDFSSLFNYFSEAKSIELEPARDPEQSIDVLLEKYFAGETSLDEEKKLKSYFNSGDVSENHMEYVPLFNYFSNAQTENLEKELELSLVKKTRVVQMRIMRNRIMGIAAGLAIVFASVFLMNNYVKY